jgi:Na+/phosphate symporter
MTEKSSSEKPFFQSFTREDVKLFMLTIVATVIANVITVIVVALAILFARSQPHPVTPGSYIILLVSTVTCIVVVPSGFFIIAAVWKGSTQNEKFIKWAGLIIFPALAIFGVIFILTWIGLAEGIH